MINVIIDDKVYTFNKGTTLLGVSKQVPLNLKEKPLVCYVDNKIEELTYELKYDC